MCYHDSNFLVSRKLYITRTNLGMISSTYIVWILSLLGNISDPYIHLGCFYFFFKLHFDSWIFDSNLLWWFLFMKHVSISHHSIYIHLFLSWQCCPIIFPIYVLFHYMTYMHDMDPAFVQFHSIHMTMALLLMGLSLHDIYMFVVTLFLLFLSLRHACIYIGFISD